MLNHHLSFSKKWRFFLCKLYNISFCIWLYRELVASLTHNKLYVCWVVVNVGDCVTMMQYWNYFFSSIAIISWRNFKRNVCKRVKTNRCVYMETNMNYVALLHTHIFHNLCHLFTCPISIALCDHIKNNHNSLV